MSERLNWTISLLTLDWTGAAVSTLATPLGKKRELDEVGAPPNVRFLLGTQNTSELQISRRGRGYLFRT